MVYLHFPSNLTDEETSLQTKYQKLRKKKKALTDLKTPKVEPEKTNLLKRPLDPKDAKELAKKLILQGKVQIPKTPVQERTTFKRSRVFERKIGMTPRNDSHGTSGIESTISASGELIHKTITDSTSSSSSTASATTLVQFQPFTPSKDVNESSPFASSPPSNINNNNNNNTNSNKPRFNSYRSGGGGGGSFGTPQNRESPRGERGELKPKRGPTLYIHGHGISESFLKDICGKYGKVVSVKLNSSSKGFVTFDKVESAETCITELNGTTQDDIILEVQFARRQPSITGNNDNSSSSWQVLATSQSHKGGHQDKRAALVYDEPI